MNRQKQRQLIAFYLSYKDQNPTFPSLIRFNLRGYFLLLFLATILITIEWLFAGWIAGLFFISFVLGAFCRDVGLHRRTCRMWPLTREIVDWQKVEAKRIELEAPISKSDQP
jgi:uncharacterized membrane protein YccF (DUF307 family)